MKTARQIIEHHYRELKRAITDDEIKKEIENVCRKLDGGTMDDAYERLAAELEIHGHIPAEPKDIKAFLLSRTYNGVNGDWTIETAESKGLIKVKTKYLGERDTGRKIPGIPPLWNIKVTATAMADGKPICVEFETFCYRRRKDMLESTRRQLYRELYYELNLPFNH
jgi:hypothetical protein